MQAFFGVSKFIGAGFTIVEGAQFGYNYVRSLLPGSETNPNKTEKLEKYSTLIKLGVVWLSERSNDPNSGYSTKLHVHDHVIIVLFPEFFQGIKHNGISVSNLMPIYSTVNKIIEQGLFNLKDSKDVLYLEVGSLGLKSMGDAYLKKYNSNKKQNKYLEASEQLYQSAKKIEEYLQLHNIKLGLHKFVDKQTVEEEKIVEEQPPSKELIENMPKQTIAVLEISNLFSERQHLIITETFKEAIESIIQKDYHVGPFARSIDNIMVRVNGKYQQSLMKAELW